MLDLELALNKLQNLEDRGISSEVVDLPSDEFVLYLVCKSLEQQCSCDHKGFDFLIIDPLEEEPFDDVLFNVELNKSRLHANSKIKASCLRDGIKKREKLFTVGLDPFDTAESIIKWICWETSPESLSLFENKTMIRLKRSRRFETRGRKGFADTLMGYVNRIDERYNEINWNEFKQTLERIQEVAENGNFKKATEMCRNLSATEEEVYDVLNSIYYTAEDLLSYFNRNVNVYWDSFGYKES